MDTDDEAVTSVVKKLWDLFDRWFEFGYYAQPTYRTRLENGDCDE